MVRVFVLYDEAPDPQRYAAARSSSAGRCRARRSATGPSSARRWASRSTPYYAEFEWPDQDSFKAGGSSAEFAATGQDAMAMGRRFSVEFARLEAL